MKVKPTQKRGHVVVELDEKAPQLLSNTAEPSRFSLSKILVPIDFSDCSKKALQYALSFAAQFRANIALVHVVQINYGGGEFGLIDVAYLETQMRETAAKQLQELARKALPEKVRSGVEVRVGRPVNEIVAVAKELEVDLIIMATHGHTGIKHVILGSTAENVVRHAPCPVLTVREHEHEFITEQQG